MTDLVEGAAEPEFTTFYVTATWDNWPEGGSYGEVVQANSDNEAEEAIMAGMAESRANEDRTEEEVRESFGRQWWIVDCMPLAKFMDSNLNELTDQELAWLHTRIEELRSA